MCVCTPAKRSSTLCRRLGPPPKLDQVLAQRQTNTTSGSHRTKRDHRANSWPLTMDRQQRQHCNDTSGHIQTNNRLRNSFTKCTTHPFASKCPYKQHTLRCPLLQPRFAPLANLAAPDAAAAAAGYASCRFSKAAVVTCPVYRLRYQRAQSSTTPSPPSAAAPPVFAALYEDGLSRRRIRVPPSRPSPCACMLLLCAPSR